MLVSYFHNVMLTVEASLVRLTVSAQIGVEVNGVGWGAVK
jgi:hypothetical protein